VVHPIDEASPLAGMTDEDLRKSRAEFIVLIKAFDDTFGQTVHVRYSYRYDEILWGARFLPAFEVDANGDVLLHLDNINKLERVELKAHRLHGGGA
jgi:inward rectifier potassium channel